MADDADRAGEIQERILEAAVRDAIKNAAVNLAVEGVDLSTECIECGEEIGAERMAAVPWAKRCIECGRDHEKRMARIGRFS